MRWSGAPRAGELRYWHAQRSWDWNPRPGHRTWACDACRV